MKQLRKRGLVIFILGLLSAIGPFSIDMYLPGFKEIAGSLHTSIAHVGLSLSSFFIGISVGQLIYGPLLDRFGRKLPLYIGLSLYLVTSILCAFVINADQLIIMRFFQALGSCAGMVAARALVRDLFPVAENAKVFSYLMLVIALSPIIAPTAGGYLTSAFGWQAIFITLAGISLFTLIAAWLWLPAGQKPDRGKSLKPIPIIKGFIEVAKIPQFYTYALVSAISASGLYAYIAGAPNLFLGIYKVTKNQFGWIFAIIALGMTIASQANTVLLKKYSSETISIWALICQVTTGIILVAFSYFGWLNLYTTAAVIMVYMATQGFVYPNTSALSLAPFSKSAGSASALMGAVQLGIGALSTAIVNALTGSNGLPMEITMLLCGLTAFTLLLIFKPHISRKKEQKVLNNPSMSENGLIHNPTTAIEKY